MTTKETKVKNPPANKVYDNIAARDKARNRRRRERYSKDAKYRRAMKEQSRSAYMASTGNTECNHLAMVEEDEIAKVGKVRTIKSGPLLCDSESANSKLTFNVTETAVVLGNYNAQVIYRWLRINNLPEMENRAYSPSELTTNVYTFDEIRKIARILNRHQRHTSCYFSKNHVDVINRIKKAVNEERGVENDSSYYTSPHSRHY